MDKRLEWVLRIAVAGEFLGNGVLALQGKKQWVGWISQLTTADTGLATQLLLLIGISDLLVALVVFIRPIKIVLLWTVFWGFWTAILRPIVGESIWDFIERFANIGAPLALLLIKGFPKNLRDFFR